MTTLSIDSAIQQIGDLYNQGIYTTKYDHTESNGHYSLQVSHYVIDHTETYDWFDVNPVTGAYTSMFNGLSGTLIVKKLIVLDAGHGDTDPGSIGSDIHESAATLITTNELRAYLESHYLVDILMTREDNKHYPTLNERAMVAVDNDADVIISVHYNHFDGTAYGYEDMIQGTTSYPATVESLALQDAVHDKVATVLLQYGIRDRGAKQADLQVLRDSYGACPGILIEGLFLDHPDDAEFFYRADWHKDYVAAVAQGIAQALNLPALNPATADFQVYSKEGNLIGQYTTIDLANTAVKNFYNAGGIDELEIKMIKPRPVAKTPFTQVIDFAGKANGDGDANRTIWFTGSYTTDQPPTALASEVNSGYAGIATKGNGTYLSYSISGAPVGRQVQFELDFGLFGIGDRQFLADNVDKITFTVTPKAGCKYYVKVWNPTNSSYKTLHADTAGNLGEKSVSILKADLMQYISSGGFIRFDLISAQKTTDTSGVTVDFDYAKITVDYSI